MKIILVTLGLLVGLTSNAGMVGKFRVPDGPDMKKTPGALCKTGNTYRYNERVRYCERNVHGSLKSEIIAEYDTELSFDIRRLPRQDFKIDHFIPLSIGGANDKGNLWPQHKSIYSITDPIESHVANLISKGRIKQADAIKAVVTCKLDLSKCKQVETHLKSLY